MRVSGSLYGVCVWGGGGVPLYLAYMQSEHMAGFWVRGVPMLRGAGAVCMCMCSCGMAGLLRHTIAATQNSANPSSLIHTLLPLLESYLAGCGIELISS